MILTEASLEFGRSGLWEASAQQSYRCEKYGGEGEQGR
jgi:hypothetical protein